MNAEDFREANFPGDRLNLNPGTLGAPSTPVRAAMRRFADENGSYPLGCYVQGRKELHALRARAAALFGAPCAFGGGATAWMSNIVMALRTDRPLRVWTSQHEHHGGIGAFEHHPGFEVRYLPDDVVADPARLPSGPRPDILFFSQITWTDGRRLPIEALRAALPEPLFIVDAAQALGVEPPAIVGDIVVASAHKWLHGPLGTGMAWLSERARDRLSGFCWAGEPLDPDGDLGRFEPAGGQDFAVYAGLRAALEVYAAADLPRGVALARGLAARLPGAAARGPVLSLPLPDPYPAYVALNAAGVHVKCVKGALRDGTPLSHLRIGVPWWESPTRLERLVTHLQPWISA